MLGNALDNNVPKQMICFLYFWKCQGHLRHYKYPILSYHFVETGHKHRMRTADTIVETQISAKTLESVKKPSLRGRRLKEREMG